MWGDGPGGKLNSRFGLQKESTGVRTAMVGATRVDVLFAPHRKGDLNHGLNWIEEQLVGRGTHKHRHGLVCVYGTTTG